LSFGKSTSSSQWDQFRDAQQHHNGDALEIFRHRQVVYEQARQPNPCLWFEQRVSGINRMTLIDHLPQPDLELNLGRLTMAA